YIFHPVSDRELQALERRDGRRLQLHDVLTSQTIPALQAAIVNFVVGACVRRLQSQRLGERRQKYSFVVHTQSSREAHTWQLEIVSALVEGLQRQGDQDSDLFHRLFASGYEDISRSVTAASEYLPPIDQVL